MMFKKLFNLFFVFFLILTVILFNTSCNKNVTIKLEGFADIDNSITSSYQVTKGEYLDLPSFEDEYIIYKNENSYDEAKDVLNVTVKKYSYYFSEWLDGTSSVDSHYQANKNKTLTASFITIEESMVIKYNLNDGSIDESNLYTIDGDVLTLSSPTLENNVFYGWCKNITLLGDKYKTINFKNNTSVNIYAIFKTDPTYVNNLIGELNNPVTVSEIDQVEKIRELYNNVSASDLDKVTNYKLLQAAEKRIEDLKDVVSIVDGIKTYADKTKLLAYDYYGLDNLKTKYDELEETFQAEVYNYSSLTTLYEQATKLYNDNIEAAKKFDHQVLLIGSYAEKNFSYEIDEANKAYNKLNENEKSLVTTYEKLELVTNNLNKELNKTLVYVTSTSDNKYIYDSKDILFKGFFTDYYFYIKAYYGLDELAQSGIDSLEEFIKCASSFEYGKYVNMTAIGHLAGAYLLKKDINGIIENQPENKYLGFCYQNGVYGSLLDFFFNFFAYWRIDEKYADLSNYGADMFAESWAPTVDIGKFFGYTIETCYVTTERMQDCYLHTSNCVTNWDDIFNVCLRGYKFVGWYDNANCEGDKITNVKNYSGILYAKWDVDSNQVDADQANKVINYIYNLTTSKAVVNETTIGYVRNMYNNLSSNAKTLVTNYQTFVNLEEGYYE